MIDNGDYVQGSPLTYFIARHHQEAAPLYSRLANCNHVQAGIFGNHEFNYGLDYLDLCESSRQYPMLAANIHDDLHRTLFSKPYTILERAGVKVAILGLTTQFVAHWEQPHHIAGLHFEDVVATAGLNFGCPNCANWLTSLSSPTTVVLNAIPKLTVQPNA